jgi:hypothetical protein
MSSSKPFKDMGNKKEANVKKEAESKKPNDKKEVLKGKINNAK